MASAISFRFSVQSGRKSSITVFCTLLSVLWFKVNGEIIYINTLDEAKKIENWIIGIRRDLHMYPEPPFEEIRTSNIIKEKLMELGIEVKLIGKTGILGVLKGKNSGKTVALRADIDALSVTEETGLSFSSKNCGFMHA